MLSDAIDREEAGIVLLMSLVILTLLSIIVISAVQSNIFSIYSNRHSKDYLIARQAAESALLEGQEVLYKIKKFNRKKINKECIIISNKKLFINSLNSIKIPEIWFINNAWNGLLRKEKRSPLSSSCHPYSQEISLNLPYVSVQPRYILEHLVSVDPALISGSIGVYEPTNKIEFFRITALGIGSNINAKILLQTTYKVYFSETGDIMEAPTRVSWRKIPLNL